MDLEEKTLESKTLYSGRVIKLTLDKAKLPNGAEASRELAAGIPGSRLLMYPEYSHALYEEARDFLDRIDGFCTEE